MKSIVTAFIVSSALVLAIPPLSQAQTAKKGKLNTNVFEKESTETSISGKVKVVREIQEETEVFVDNAKGNNGPYVLPQNIKNRAGLLKILNKSQKPGGRSVTIGIDDQQRIKSVEESESSTNTPDWGS